MPPTRPRLGRVGTHSSTQDPPTDSHKSAQWRFYGFLLFVPRWEISCSRGRETLLRLTTSIAQDAFMSTTGEAGATPGEAVRRALTAPTGVAP